MAKKEHRFNPQTLTYEVITAPFRLRTYRLLRKILIGFILISVANVLFSYFFYTPKMYRINRANRELVMKYRIMQDRLKASESKGTPSSSDPSKTVAYIRSAGSL